MRLVLSPGRLLFSYLESFHRVQYISIVGCLGLYQTFDSKMAMIHSFNHALSKHLEKPA